MVEWGQGRRQFIMWRMLVVRVRLSPTRGELTRYEAILRTEQGKKGLCLGRYLILELGR